MPDNNRSPGQGWREGTTMLSAKANIRRATAPLTLAGVLILIIVLTGCAAPGPSAQEHDTWRGYPGCLPRFD